MERAKLMDVHVQMRRTFNLLGEVEDLSQQLAEAVDRGDQVAVRMLLAMRSDPIRQLSKTRENIQRLLEGMEPDEAAHLRALLNGGTSSDPAEQALADQAASNARRLKQVQILDERLSKKIAREKSIYK